MKYKNIDSMLHNFGHSFVSLMNYIDDGYIVDDLFELAISSGGEIEIDFSSGKVRNASAYSERLHKSIQLNIDWLPKHMRGHNVDPSAIGPVVIKFKVTRLGKEVIVEATDDRGIKHIQRVSA